MAVLLCVGASCELVPLEPGVSYPTDQECAAALAAKGKALGDAAVGRRQGARGVETVCLQATQTITEVEDRYEALETVIAHAGPSVDSGYMGLVEGGRRVLVTGVVDGTKWLRVWLADGGVGFVYADRLRKVAAQTQPSPAGAAPNPARPPVDAAPASRAPAAAPPGQAAPAEFQDCSTCPVMKSLPGGSVLMGSNLDPSERPVHRVTIPAFALGKFEVTASEWRACADAGGCEYKPPPREANAERRPATNLSWDDAVQYVRWLQQTTGKPYRLPSEAEWEYAARAGTTTRYAWGEQPGTGQANCEGCGGPYDPRSPADVSAFPANPWGIAGTQGGVAEWMEDCWHISYRGAPADGSAWREPNCQRRVLRGGSWRNPPAGITVSSRNFYDAGVRYLANGLRVALTLP